MKNLIKKCKKILSKNSKLLKFYFFYCNKITFRSSRKKSRKEIVVVFDGNFPHGGLVDRLKGIISFYQVAKKIDADFKIYFNNPFDLIHFLEPNTYDWVVNDENLSWNPFDTKILYLMLHFDFDPLHYISNSRKKKFIVFCNIDYSKTINTALTKDEQEKDWSACFHELFKKSHNLNAEYLKLNIIQNNIAIHTRFTTLFGDFNDSTKLIATDKRKNEIKNNLKIAIDTIAMQNLDKIIYIFSDSIQFLQFIKNNSDYLVIDGVPQHIDSDKNNNEVSNHTKTFLDFFAIAVCEKVFLMRTNDMHNSAFSKYAAIVGNKEFEVINLNK